MAEINDIFGTPKRSTSYTDENEVTWFNENPAPWKSDLPEQSYPILKRKTVLGCVSIKWMNTLLAILTIITSVSMVVTLPIYAGAVNRAGGDTYVVLFNAGLWFPVVYILVTLCIKFSVDRSITLRPKGNVKIIAAIGFLTGINALLVVYASPPNRTAPYLQGILSTVTIPFTVIGRYLVLRKAIGLRRLFCTGVVVIGLFITMEPQIWALQGSGITPGSTSAGGAKRVIWPLVFVLGLVPGSLSNILIEKEGKKEEAQSLSFLTWMQIFQFLTILVVFWTDFISGFGETDSIEDFITRLRTGLSCHFSSSPDCHGVAYKSWLFMGSYCTSALCSFLLIRYSEGAVYNAVVQALVAPLATFFWSFFNDDNYFHWAPAFNITTGFTIAGVALIMPAVIMYSYFSRKEEAVSINENIIVVNA